MAGKLLSLWHDSLWRDIALEQLVILFMLIFARIGTCLMFMPGFGTSRMPMKYRLFLALAFSASALNFLSPSILQLSKIGANPALLSALASEALVGASFGLAAHLFIWALQFMATLIAMTMGFSGQPGHGIIESMPETPLSALISLAGLMLFFASDLHLEVLKGLLHSYQLVPASFYPRPQAALIDYRDGLERAFLTLLHIGAPFFVYSLLASFSVGILTKLTPAIPVYFITVPVILAGGIFLVYLLLPELLSFFSEEIFAFLE